MKRLKLVLPCEKDKDKILDYKREFIESGDNIDGSAGLQNAKSFEDWYEAFCDNQKEETVREPLVPSSTFMAITIDKEELVGMIDIRHRLNDYLMNFGGHIGYSVRKSQRLKGYASEMLFLALKECEKLNISKVLITCNQNNIGSAKTILKNAGKLENEVAEETRITQRYWIDLV
ncbi:MAG: GNAT family N-acetyltransferase [Firmicutes bacterium]|jgi:predicted acetyltransferase|nr:GNAT family N-acetyltransferase [Bacillota bacterium]